MATVAARNSCVLLTCVLLAWRIGLLHAEETELEEVTVHGQGETLPGEPDLTVSSTTIEMSEYDDQLVTVAEVLDRVAGVSVRRFGGLGDFATVSIRGSSGEQVQIYLDGIPLNQASGGAVNLATIPAPLIETITIYRGQAPVRFGTSAIGGVIDIRTKRATKHRNAEIRNSFGSLLTYEGTGLYSQGFGSTDILTSYNYARSNGDFKFKDDNGTPGNPNDDAVVKRENNQFQRHDALLKVGQQITDDLAFEFHNDFFYEDHGVPGLGTLKSDTANLKTLRNMTSTRFRLDRLAEDNFAFETTPLFSFNKSQFKDLNGNIGLGVQDNDDDTYLYGADAIADYYLGTHQHFTFYTAYRGEQFHPENKAAATSTGTASIRNRATFAVEDEIVLWNERILINPLLRFEMIFNNLSADDPSITSASQPDNSNDFPVTGKIGTRVLIVKGLHARGSFGRSFRIPSFLELFGDRGAIVGNPSLEPESSWNGDVGLDWQQPQYRISATYFESRTNNLIQFLQTAQFTAQARNLGSGTNRGAEFEALATIPLRSARDDNIQFNLNYTFQWAKDTSSRNGFDGKFLPGRPIHQVHAGATAKIWWFSPFVNFDFIDDNFLDSFNTLRVDNRSLLGAGLGVQPLPWLLASFEVKNILNQQIVDVVGFPVPGRLYFGNLNFQI